MMDKKYVYKYMNSTNLNLSVKKTYFVLLFCSLT